MTGRRGVSLTVATAAVSSLIAVAACGVRTPLSDPPYAGTTSGKGTPDADAMPDASVPREASTDTGANPGDASPDVALPVTNLGNVLLTSGDYRSGALESVTATGVFFPFVAATGCNIVSIAGCTLETCAGSAAAAPTANAGSIAVTGGLYALLLQQGSSGHYAPTFDGGLLELWTGGEPLVVTGSGDVVPPFVGTVVAPTEVAVLTPMPSLISRATPFTISWLGSSAGQLTVDLSATSGGTSSYVECQFEVAAATGVLPAEALGAMPAGTAALEVSTVSTSVVGDGAWTVKLFAQTDGSDPTGAQYKGYLKLQ